jgi:hypothetical protein
MSFLWSSWKSLKCSRTGGREEGLAYTGQRGKQWELGGSGGGSGALGRVKCAGAWLNVCPYTGVMWLLLLVHL